MSAALFISCTSLSFFLPLLGYAIIIHDIAKFVNIFFIIFLTMPSFCVIVLLSKGGNSN
nr:MAG TPA: hypothetical protein [Caudoviricetes sp.]